MPIIRKTAEIYPPPPVQVEVVDDEHLKPPDLSRILSLALLFSLLGIFILDGFDPHSNDKSRAIILASFNGWQSPFLDNLRFASILFE